MTTGREAGPIPRWLVAAGVCAALLAQMTAPVLHALEIESATPRTAPTWQEPSSPAPVVLAASQAAPAHDSATCPVCRSLTRTNPVASTWVARAEPIRERVTVLAATPPCARSAAVQGGHPPRAPPSSAHLS